MVKPRGLTRAPEVTFKQKPAQDKKPQSKTSDQGRRTADKQENARNSETASVSSSLSSANLEAHNKETAPEVTPKKQRTVGAESTASSARRSMGKTLGSGRRRRRRG